jgi:hypothetical protein
MSISSVSSAPVSQTQAPRAANVDADGDNDGTKASAATPTVQVSKPTATLGNNIDVHA